MSFHLWRRSVGVKPRRQATVYCHLRLESLESRVTPTTLPTGFVETLVNTGGALTAPTRIDFAPDGRLFVTEQGGTLALIKNGTPQAALTLTVNSSGERGLLGLAFDPNFASNHFIYLYYTATTPTIHNRVSRFAFSTVNPDVVDPATELPIIDLETLGATNHNGGEIHFGSDGELYVSVGENAVSSNSQTLSNRLGKILRINSDGSLPANPFDSQATGVNRAIWALGLRNPYSFAVQPGTGRLFINDVGESSFEEIDDGIAGSNYGWPNSEGFKQPGDTATTIGTYRDPLLAYSHSGSPGGTAITGGVFYNPAFTQFPAAFAGKYFYSDLGGNYIRTFDPATPNVSAAFAGSTAANPVDLKVDAAGNLYYVAYGTGEVRRITYVQHVVAAGSDAGGGPNVKLFSAADPSIILANFNAYASNFTGGVRVAMADMNGDTIPDIITAPGPGNITTIKVFNGADPNIVLQSFDAYGNFGGGVYVATGDVNGDGVPDIITGPGAGGGPNVKVFNGASAGQVLQNFNAYGNFGGGVRVAAGDFNADGKADIVTAPGPGGGPNVKVFAGTATSFAITGAVTLQNFNAYDNFAGGVFVAVGDVNGDTIPDIITGADAGGGANVKVFGGGNPAVILQNFDAYQPFGGGVRVGVTDVDGNGRFEIVTAPGAGGGPNVKVFDGITLTLLDNIDAFGTFNGGVFVASH